jgi:hypothetical protein
LALSRPGDADLEIGYGLQSRDEKLGIALGAERREANELRIAFDRSQHLAKARRIADAIQITDHVRKVRGAGAHECCQLKASDRERRCRAFALGADQIGGNLGAGDLGRMRRAGLHPALQ